MADAELRNLTAQTAMDDTYLVPVSDDTTGDLKKATIADVLALGGGLPLGGTDLGSDRLNASGAHSMVMGPIQISGVSATQGAGQYVLGLFQLRGGTPTSVEISIDTAGGVSDTAYWVVYDIDGEGHPGSLVHEWGPFDVSATGYDTLTGQTETVTEGWYWAGAFTPVGNTGAPKFDGGISAAIGPIRDITWATRPGIGIITSDSTPASTQTGVMRTSSGYEASNSIIGIMAGWHT